MNFPFYIAKRYLFSKKSHNIINIISGISIAGVTVGTMALIIVLSVFNGFESLVVSLFNSFNPEIQIVAKYGKSFEANSIPADKIKNIEGVAYYNEVIEDVALVKYQSKQDIVTIKGVNDDFQKLSRLDTMIIDGKFVLQNGVHDYAVVGQAIAYKLGLNLKDQSNLIEVYVPRRGSGVSLDPTKAFNSKNIFASGIFSVQQEFDSKYVIVPLRFAREIFEYPTKLTSVELGLKRNANLENVQKEIQATVGSQYVVKNRFQQQEVLYKIMKSEKWAIFLILTFILIIATFNVIGTMIMIIIDKRKDISVLWCLGADQKLLRRIFLFEGVLVSIIGALLGIILGGFVCFIQQKFGIVSLQASGSFVVDAYPIQMKLWDFIMVFFTVFGIGIITIIYPVLQISTKFLNKKF